MRDEDFYGLAAREVVEQTHSVGLMAKAYALSLGEAEKTKALYIGMRANQLKEEFINNQRLERAKARIQKLAEEERAKKAKAEEAVRKKEEQKARRRKEDREAQFAGDVWSNGGYEDRRRETSIILPTIPPTSSKEPEPPEREELMSVEELDQLVESLKRASQKLGSF